MSSSSTDSPAAVTMATNVNTISSSSATTKVTSSIPAANSKPVAAASNASVKVVAATEGGGQRFRNGGQWFRGRTTNATGVIVAACVMAESYLWYRDFVKDDKKKVLVIPFDKLYIRESPGENMFGGSQLLPRCIGSMELIDAIHAAASDDSIAAIYGTFGRNGAMTDEVGWSQLEDIRNALTVFRQSHRVHLEPSSEAVPPKQPKPMFAYASTFNSMLGPNKEYYLASIFSYIHLQKNGELNLLGHLSQQYFLRDVLQKYGVQLHVFKHGIYKNAPNMFTHSALTKPHRENIETILYSIQNDVCNEMSTGRGYTSPTFCSMVLSQQTPTSTPMEAAHSLWQRVREAGTVSASVAQQAGLVDALPRRDPLLDLIDHKDEEVVSETTGDKDDTTDALKENEDDVKPDVADDSKEQTQNPSNDNTAMTIQTDDGDEKEKAPSTLATSSSTIGISSDTASRSSSVSSKWNNNETNFEEFLNVESSIDIWDYVKSRKSRRQQWGEWFHDFCELLSSLKLKDTLPSQIVEFLPSAIVDGNESVALLYVDCGIGDDEAQTIIDAIRPLRKKKGTKALVVRVNSPGGSIVACETVSQELQGLDIPVIVSFGDVSASGGYYISAAADRIFCSNKTITGSIGVFGIRADLTGLAAKYGVKTETVKTSEMAGMCQPFEPMSKNMKLTIADSIDRAYDQFKTIVSDGRDLSMDHVESVAQGRVWTGIQAKDIGLVDELGGLDRAIGYAKREYCASSCVPVVNLSKQKSVFQQLLTSESSAEVVQAINKSILNIFTESSSVDEQFENCDSSLLQSSSKRMHQQIASAVSLPKSNASFSGILLTADENTAIQLLLGQQQRK